MSVKNHEGYADPTAAVALANIARDERAVRRPHRPIAYIASPYRGDVERNVERAKDYCRFALGADAIPLAPHLMYPQFLDDADREQRKLGLSCALALLARCDELWVMGGDISDGMLGEMEEAHKRGIPIRYFGDDYEEVFS